MKRLRRVFSLSQDNRQLLLATLGLLTAVRLGLWLLPFRRVLQLLAYISQPTPGQQASTAVSRIVWAVEVVSRCMPGEVKCLARALVTQVLMNRCGYLAHLRIGVAKDAQGTLQAHAWIEHQGKVAIGQLADLSRYVPLPSIEGIKQ